MNSTPSPARVTTPTHSLPSAPGSPGYMPIALRTSRKFRPLAADRAGKTPYRRLRDGNGPGHDRLRAARQQIHGGRLRRTLIEDLLHQGEQRAAAPLDLHFDFSGG